MGLLTDLLGDGNATSTPLERAALGLDQFLVWDTFTRPDDAASLGTSDSGHAWTAGAGTWGIDANRAKWASGSATNASATVDANEVDVAVTADVLFDIAGCTLLLRYVDASNFLLVALAASFFRIRKCDAGVFTDLASVAHVQKAGRVYRLHAEVREDNITARIDPNTSIELTLSAGDNTKYGAATRYGIGANNTNTNARFDNFVVRSLV